MDIEFEATFPNIDKENIRSILKGLGAVLIRAEYLQKRVSFTLPKGSEIDGGWLRVRDEGDKITMSLKVIDGTKIEDQRETSIVVDSFENTVSILKEIGCEQKAYQESKRELWKFGDVEVMIDEWPFLEPFVEIEGKSEEDVRRVSKDMGFDYKDALFCSVATLYNLKYNISEEEINNDTPLIVFNGTSPFLTR